MKSFDQIREKHLTPAEMKKREEVAKAIKRENPNMPMAKKMAIATATAKKVAEETKLDQSSSKGKPFDMVGYLSRGMKYDPKTSKMIPTKVAESVQDMASMGGRSLARIANTVGHPDSAAAKNELARRRMKNEERVISGGYRDKDGKYHPPKTASSIAKDRLAKKAAIMKKTAAAMRNEDTELDESITRVSDAKLKFHAVNGVPHGSYSKSEISAEHNRRKKTGGAEYAAVKPSTNEAVTEAADMSKLKLLARAGLVDSKDVERLMSAFKVMQAGKPLTQQQKDLVISSYGELASIVTGDSQTFQKAKKAVNKLVGEEVELDETSAVKKWDTVRVNKQGDEHHGKTGVINRSRFGSHTVSFKNNKVGTYDAHELVKKESVELDEVSQATKDRYIAKSAQSHQHNAAVARDAKSRGDETTYQHARKIMKKRNQGMARAFGQTKDNW